VVGGAKTSPEASNSNGVLCVNRQEAHLPAKGIPGHVTNRLQAALLSRDFLYLIQQDVLSVAEAGRRREYGPGCGGG